MFKIAEIELVEFNSLNAIAETGGGEEVGGDDSYVFS